MKTAKDFLIPFSWDQRKTALIEKCLIIPEHYDQHESFSVDWNDASIFEKKQSIIIEYCSGNGEWIGELAQKNPLNNWIAVEKDFERARKIWARIFRLNLKNLFLVFGDGFTFTKYYLPDQSIEKIFINFPDPWPKRRHHKNRIIQKSFVVELERILKEKGQAIVVTDDESYSQWIIQHFSKWKSAFAPQMVTLEWESFGQSYFFTLWKSLSRSIRYHQFENPIYRE